MNLVFILIGAIIGFVVGALVYRNNAKKLESKVSELEGKLKNLKEKF